MGCEIRVYRRVPRLPSWPVAGPAAAERLVASLTNHHVMITSNYTGVELVLFGSVERDATSLRRAGPYDIVATVTGPREIAAHAA